MLNSEVKMIRKEPVLV